MGMAGPSRWTGLSWAAVWLLVLAGLAGAAETERLDWDAWQRIPVLHGGRIKPLDTFARQAVEEICGRQSPRLSMAGAPQGRPDLAQELSDSAKLFPDGRPRRFEASELLFSWLVEPERWEHVPFLRAGHERLRRDLLEVPITDERAGRLKYVSPWQVANSKSFQTYCAELAARQAQTEGRNGRSELGALDKKVTELYQAYMLYRMLTYNPVSPALANNRFTSRLEQALRTWTSLEPSLSMVGRFGVQEGMKQLIGRTAESARSLAGFLPSHAQHQPEEATPERVEPLLLSLRESAFGLAEQFRAHTKRLRDAPPEGIQSDRLEQMRSHLRTLGARTAELARHADRAILALYDNGQSLRLVPALDQDALESNRDEREDTQWLSLQALIVGSQAVVGEYPADGVAEVRRAFQRVGAAYLDRSQPDRPERFADAMRQFALSLRRLGEAVEPMRRALPIKNRDEDLLARTAYPAPGFTDAEIRYNRLDPFFWSWSLCLVALAGLSLSFGAMRKAMFWLGTAVLALAVAATVAGLGFRWHITGLVPVTNMFESVVFAALVVAGLGVWFTLLPLFWPGLTTAWRMTALPFTWEASPVSDQQAPLADRAGYWKLNWLFLVLRLLIAAAILVVLTCVPYGGTGRALFGLLPRTDVGSSVPSLNHLVVWAVGLCVVALAVWYVPRAALALTLGCFTIPYCWATQSTQEAIEEALSRRVFALVGAAVGFLGAALAYYAPAPVFVREISPIRPILRDNFWLLLHVLTITASYGAGALAWGLGNIALGYYLLGRYGDQAAPSTETAAGGDRPAGNWREAPQFFRRRPPDECAGLASFIYRSTQVALLLLIAGTILGAMWADVAWGRFWGWDSKEVAALISALVYLLILHGRHAGWFGNFGLAVGSVLGATAIVAAWYGVNYVFGSGLHSYGTGAGGQWWVSSVIAINWLFMAAASARYLYETRSPARYSP